MVLIGATLFSQGCSTKYKNVHVKMTPIEICSFDRFSDEEKETMTNDVGSKIARNQNDCRVDRDKYNTLIELHNEAHK